MTAIPFYIDLKSPYSYIAAHRGLELMRQGKTQFDWLPFTLDLSGRPDMPGWRNRARYVYRDVRRFAAPLGLTIRGPKEIYDSTTAQIGLLYAKRFGDPEVYIENVFAAFFQRELAPDDVAGVTAQLEKCGCPTDIFTAFLEGEGAKVLNDIRAEAETAGVFAVPSVIVDGELYWGQDRFDMAMEAAGV
jgi:2-hydroxychromene-2-carboxylate isomerase